MTQKTLVDCSTLPGHLKGVCDGSHRKADGSSYSLLERLHIISRRMRVSPDSISLRSTSAIAEAESVDHGIGTEVSTILKSLGINAEECGACRDMIQAMNRGGPEWCKANRDVILTRLRDRAAKAGWWVKRKAELLAVSTGLFLHVNWSDPAPGILDLATKKFVESESNHPGITRPPVACVAVSVRTCKRPEPTLQRTLESLRAAGFAEPILFGDENAEGTGSFLAFVECSKHLLSATAAEWLLVCEDDVEFTDGLAAKLAGMIVGNEIVTLFKPHGVTLNGVDFVTVPAVNGSLAVLVHRDDLRRVIESQTAKAWLRHDCVDNFLTKVARELRLAIKSPVKSLVQHIGRTSVCQPERWKHNSLTHRMRFASDLPRPTAVDDVPGVTLITPTGDRPDAFSLCEAWIERQTFKGPVQWIVVDDGVIPTHCSAGQQYVRRQPSSGEGHTLTRNLREAIPLIRADKVLVIEDDEWYAPNYVEQMAAWLDEADLVGVGIARYYWPRDARYREFPNHTHASLCRTGFRADKILHQFAACCESDHPSVDLRLWSMVSGVRYDSATPLVVGMKQMPGRKSGGGDPMSGADDSSLSVLRSWIGDDVRYYKPLLPNRGTRPIPRSARTGTTQSRNERRAESVERRLKHESDIWRRQISEHRPQALVMRNEREFERRSLMFHCYPRLGADWQASCIATFRYRDVFNGKIVVSVVTGDGCESPDVVADWFRQFVQPEEINFVKNIARDGINTTFRDQLRAIRHEPGIVFKSHTKGISHGNSCDFWRDNMVRGCLADVNLVQQKFSEGYVTFGSYKTFSVHGASVMGQISGPCKTEWPGWHYPGACFWFDPRRIPDRVFSLPPHHYENEAFPCHMIPSELAYSLTPDNVSFRETGIGDYLQSAKAT